MKKKGGLQAIKYFLNQLPVKSRAGRETLLRLPELVLTFNWFSFDYNYYKQIKSTGIKMGPKLPQPLCRLYQKYFFSSTTAGQNLIFT